MKKLILLFGIAVLCTGCPDLSHIGDTYWDWYIVNNTDNTLIFKYPSSPQIMYSGDKAEIKYLKVELAPGASKILHYEHLHYKTDVGEILLGSYFETSASRFGEEVSWQILSEEDVVLKEWKYSDKDLPEQRFFDESEWNFDEDFATSVNGGKVIYTWTFSILPEDIVSE